MSAESIARENRRRTRVRVAVRITAQAVNQPLTCEGETVVVNLHGALISTSIPYAWECGLKSTSS